MGWGQVLLRHSTSCRRGPGKIYPCLQIFGRIPWLNGGNVQLLDKLDRRILAELQRDASQSLGQLAEKLGASKTPIWNRVRRLRSEGVIGVPVVIIDPEKLGFDACFFVLIRISEHEAEWQEKFLQILKERPEVLEAHRLAGDIDYILKVRVENARAYDAFYQALIAEVKLFNVSALLSMEEIKSTTQIAFEP